MLVGDEDMLSKEGEALASATVDDFGKILNFPRFHFPVLVRAAFERIRLTEKIAAKVATVEKSQIELEKGKYLCKTVNSDACQLRISPATDVISEQFLPSNL